MEVQELNISCEDKLVQQLQNAMCMPPVHGLEMHLQEL